MQRSLKNMAGKLEQIVRSGKALLFGLPCRLFRIYFSATLSNYVCQGRINPILVTGDKIFYNPFVKDG